MCSVNKKEKCKWLFWLFLAISIGLQVWKNATGINYFLLPIIALVYMKFDEIESFTIFKVTFKKMQRTLHQAENAISDIYINLLDVVAHKIPLNQISPSPMILPNYDEYMSMVKHIENNNEINKTPELKCKIKETAKQLAILQADCMEPNGNRFIALDVSALDLLTPEKIESSVPDALKQNNMKDVLQKSMQIYRELYQLALS